MREFQATFGDLVIDGPAWEVRMAGEVIDLTRTEVEILLVLAARPRQAVTDEEVVRAVWGDGWFGDENNLAVHVSKLRRKLGESGLHQRFIRTVRGVGYRFDPGPDGDRPAQPASGALDALLSEPGAVEVRTDGELRVVAIVPSDGRLLGHESRTLLGRYFALIEDHPWADHASAREGIEILISSGVREWTARHAVRRADGTRVQADVATCMEIHDGRLRELRFVVVERGGGGDSRILGHRGGPRLA